MVLVILLLLHFQVLPLGNWFSLLISCPPSLLLQHLVAAVYLKIKMVLGVRFVLIRRADMFSNEKDIDA